MTNPTANLSIGLKTGKAKQDLAELKKWLQTEMRSIAVSIDPQSIDRSVANYLRQRTFKIKVNTKDLSAEIENEVGLALDRAMRKQRDLRWNQAALQGGLKAALEGTFGQRRRVNFDADHLRGELGAAISSVFGQPHKVNIDAAHLRAQLTAAGTVSVSGAGGAAHSVRELAPEIAATIKQTLGSAVDELVKAASTIGATARRVSALEGASQGGKGGVSASLSKSAVLSDGSRLAVRATVDDVKQALDAVDDQNSEKLYKGFAVLAAKEAQIRVAVTAAAEAASEAARLSDATKAARDAAAEKKRQEDAMWAAYGQQNSAFDKTARRGLEGQAAQAKVQARKEATEAEQRAKAEIAAQVRLQDELNKAIDEQAALAREIERVRAQGLKSAADRVKAEAQIEALEQRQRDAAWDRAQAEERLQQAKQRSSAFLRAEAEQESSRQRLLKQAADLKVAEANAQQRLTEQANGEIAAHARLQDELNKAIAEQAALAKEIARLRTMETKSAADRVKTEAQVEALEQRQRDAAWDRAQAEEKLQQSRQKSAAFALAESEQEASRQRLLKQAAEARAAEVAAQQRLTDLANGEIAAHQRLVAEMAEELRLQKASAAAAQGRKLGAIYDQAKGTTGQAYTGLGVQIAGAKALVEHPGVGPDLARSFLGRKSFLVDLIPDLDRYAKGTDEGTKRTTLFTRAMSEAHSGARGLAGSLGQMWLTWGSTVPLVAGAAIGMGIRSVISNGKDLEYQLTFVKGLTDEATISMDRFRLATKNSMFLPVEAADGLRALAQNGLSSQQALMALPEILRLATVGEMGMSEAALGATGVMAAFNLQVTDLGRVSDVFAKAAAISNTSVSGMVEAMKQASTVGDQYGLTIEQTAASLAVMAKRNIEGSAAGTALRNMMTELAAPSKKAQAAMKQMGLELYDSNNKLKDYTEILGELKRVTDGLGEKGKLAFLQDLFDERGAKAANALLSDFDLLKDSIRVMNQESEGFTSSISQMLSQTTTGKLKALAADFQSVSASVFELKSNSIKNVIDELRDSVNSPELSSALGGLVDLSVNLVRSLNEHPAVIGGVVAAWWGLRAAMAGTAVAATGAWSAILGPIGLIGGLAASFLLLSRHTTDAQEAYDQYARSIKESIQTLDDEIARSREQNTLLARKIQLMRDGKTAAEAQRIAESETPSAKELDGQARANDLRAQMQRDQERLRSLDPSDKSTRGERVLLQQQLRDAQARLATVEKDLAVEKAKRTEAAQLRSTLKDNTEREGLFAWFQDYSRKAKANPKLEGLDLSGLRNRPTEALKQLKEDLDARMNSVLGDYTPTNPQEQRAANRDALASVKEKEAAYKRQVDALDAAYSAEEAIVRAREQAKLITVEEYERLTEENAKRHLANRKALAQSELNEIQGYAASNPKLDTAQRKELDTRIENARAKVGTLEQDLNRAVEVASIKAQGKLAQIAQQAQDARVSGVLRDMKALQDMARQASLNGGDIGPTGAAYIDFLKKNGRSSELSVAAQAHADELRRGGFMARQSLMGDGSAASRKAGLDAAMKAFDEWQPEVSRLTVEVSKAQDELATALAQGPSKDEGAIRDRIDNLNAQLDNAKKLQEFSANDRGDLARTIQTQQESAQAGLVSFWKKYTDEAGNAANLVSSVMAQSFSSMENGLMQFVTTGKLNFKSLVNSMLADAARMMANAAIKQLIGMGLNLVMGGLNSAPTPTGTSATSVSLDYSLGSSFGPITPSANGNVMTSEGPLALRKYAKGGIARSPQLSLFGEGRTAEAYVPLPDGRSIPVTMSGASGGGDTSVVIQVHVESNGQSKVESDSSGQKAEQLGKLIEAQVREVITKEKRQGGLLYS